MRQSQAAVALIRRIDVRRTLWLARWNRRWRAFHFVGGHKRPRETFRECLLREIAEELALREEVDFLAALEPIAHLEYDAWSRSAKADTRYVIELFNVELSSGAHAKVASNSANRWLTETEIAAGQTHDGRPVSATMKRLLGEVSSDLCRSNAELR
jgi:8-oxo-dGTP pyrophosphatase MutT (NUDIX family)